MTSSCKLYLPFYRLLFVQLDKLVHLIGLQRQEAERADRQGDISLIPDALQHLLQRQRVDLPLLRLLPDILINQSTRNNTPFRKSEINL